MFVYEQGFTDEAFNVGFENFLASPFGLTDFYSWVLVIVGLFFAVVALFDGRILMMPILATERSHASLKKLKMITMERSPTLRKT